jgi:hypothetical protein
MRDRSEISAAGPHAFSDRENDGTVMQTELRNRPEEVRWMPNAWRQLGEEKAKPFLKEVPKHVDEAVARIL